MIEREKEKVKKIIDDFFISITKLDTEENGREMIAIVLRKVIGSIIVSIPPSNRVNLIDYVVDLCETVANERFEDTEDLQSFLKDKDFC